MGKFTKNESNLIKVHHDSFMHFKKYPIFNQVSLSNIYRNKDYKSKKSIYEKHMHLFTNGNIFNQ